MKSGYQLALKLNHSEDPGCSGNILNQWNVIWTLDLPEKIKIFIWRATNNLLPTAENLWKKEDYSSANMSKMQQDN